MIFIVLSQVSFACGPISSSFDLLNAPTAGLGLVFEGPEVPVREDFVFTVDGADAAGELRAWTDPHTGRSLALFLPEPALVEGQAYHVVTSDGAGGEIVTDGVVAAAAEQSSPRIGAVTLGAVEEGSGADCLVAGEKYRGVEVEVTAGNGVMVLTDQDTGEVVRVAYMGGEAATLAYLREGSGGGFACVEPTNVRLDGGELSGAAVCSDQGNVCDCASASGAGVGYALGGLVFALRRSRRRR